MDQDNPSSGVAALPMILAQCDAVVSLIDNHYYGRAWCSVEAMMISTLRNSYGVHQWYEQPIEGKATEGGRAAQGCGMLRDGPMGLSIDMAEKKLSFEEERPQLLFLERQIRLLG